MSELIIPDIHEKHEKLARILKRYEPEVDHTTILGDWYDQWGTLQLFDVKETAQLHRESIEHPKRTVLNGNHDMPYKHKNVRGLMCSGHNPFKYETMDSIVTPDHWKQTKLFTFVNGYLISHAGIHQAHISSSQSDQLKQDLELFNQDCIESLQNGQMHFLVGAGRARGGNQQVGGITWLDFNREFQPVMNLNQIVGHTHGKEVKMKHSESMNSKNYCIDTDLNHVAIINDNGSITIIDVSEV